METDHELVQKAKQGDMNAFSQLVLRHQKALLRMAFRVLSDLEAAQDVVQESFMKAFQKLSTFEERAQFKSWMYQITLNTAKNKIRGRRPEMVEISTVHLHGGSQPDDEVVKGDLKIYLKQEIEKLPQRQRQALSLRIFEDLSFAEIAEIMKCPYDTAKANYRHALMKLRHSLGDTLVLKSWKSEARTEIGSTRVTEVDA